MPVEEGVVPGGGVAYIRAAPALEALENELEGDQRVGVRIIRRALEEPMRSTYDDAYKRRVLEAYPREPDGKTLFPFRRLFFVAKK